MICKYKHYTYFHQYLNCSSSYYIITINILFLEFKYINTYVKYELDVFLFI